MRAAHSRLIEGSSINSFKQQQQKHIQQIVIHSLDAMRAVFVPFLSFLACN